MQIIHGEPELPFEIRSDPCRRHAPEPKPLDAFLDRLWWMAVGDVVAMLILAAIGTFM